MGGDRFQQMSDVIAHIEAGQHFSDEPCGRKVENRHPFGARVPRALSELVGVVAGFAAEQHCQSAIPAGQDMDRQIVGSASTPRRCDEFPPRRSLDSETHARSRGLP